MKNRRDNDPQLAFDFSATAKAGAIGSSGDEEPVSTAAPAAHRAPPVPDQPARDAIVRERAQNLVVVAGAGTGKTTILVERILDMVAPEDDRPAYDLSRFAAITFTRKAAGELRFRVRAALLAAYANTAPTSNRGRQLYTALSQLDTAFIGTIHSFAERLLRLRPVEAQLSPQYTIAEDTDGLIVETMGRLKMAVDLGTLPDLLSHSSLPAEVIDDAAQTWTDYELSGERIERSIMQGVPLASMRELVESFITSRDIDVPLPDSEFDQAAFVAAVHTFAKISDEGATHHTTHGERQVHAVAQKLVALVPSNGAAFDLGAACGTILRIIKFTKLERSDFPKKSVEWDLWKALRGDDPNQKCSVPRDLRDRLHIPLVALARRLVRLRPAVVAVYERLKAERGEIDQIDLLLKLRDMLADPAHASARAYLAGRFDHVFIDEFQDTDPLQVEVVFYLCEKSPTSEPWKRVALAPGKLTIVGDPKQSIYRFRRADTTTYTEAVETILAQGGVEHRLTTNFRSKPELLEALNATLEPWLDQAGGDAPIPHEKLEPPPGVAPTDQAVVHHIPYKAPGGASFRGVDDGRPVEAQAIARYVRWLIHHAPPVRDQDDGRRRPLRPSDIAVLAPVTSELPLLLRELDAIGVAYTARGGHLFLGHPIIRRALLALRGLSDRHDGAATASLLTPPFFALEPADLLAERLVARHGDALELARDDRVAVERTQNARGILGALQSKRHSQSPGATLRDLIEQSLLEKGVVTGENGRQIRAALYQLAFELDRLTQDRGATFEHLTELLREWAERPGYYDAPEPLDQRAIQVMSIHQAKGLEFPVVILWDSFYQLQGRVQAPFVAGRDGRSWAMRLSKIAAASPDDTVLDTEKSEAKAEGHRLFYVAATRARDLLVLPGPQQILKRGLYPLRALWDGLGELPVDSKFELETFVPDAPPAWASAGRARDTSTLASALEIDADVEAASITLEAAIHAASRARAWPLAMSHAPRALASRVERAAIDDSDASSGGDASVPAVDHAILSVDDASADWSAENAVADKHGGARFGAQFGTTVHRALELILEGTAATPEDAVRTAAREHHLASDQTADAIADVRRALDSLADAGLDDHGVVTEQPVVLAREGMLLRGVIDLLLHTDDEVLIIDFKTDTAREGASASAYPEYATQLALYEDAVRATGLVGDRVLRSALLLTETGDLAWR